MSEGDEEQNLADDSELSPRPAHTPLPWRYVETDCAGYVAAGAVEYRPHWKGLGSTEELRANAEFIVRAVNAHDALVKIARQVVFMFGNANTYPERTIGHTFASDARAALESDNVAERETDTRT